MIAPKPPAFATLSLHAGQHPDTATGARAVPIHQTTSFVFQDTDHAAALLNLERTGYSDACQSNPTVAVLEERVAALEGGVGAVATASGVAALHLAIATLMGAGGHIVASTALNDGALRLLAHTLPRFGIKTTFVPPRDIAAWRSVIRPETRAFIGSTIGSRGLEVLDIPGVSDIAHGAGLPLLVDNTQATPWLCRPIEHGADIVVHSLTEWIGGHGVAMGGALVDGGRFDWENATKFPTLTEASGEYPDLIFTEQFGPLAFISCARTEGLRAFGACLSPATAFQLLQGVETLPLRMQRHMENTAAVLEFLGSQSTALSVFHPSLPSHGDHVLAARLLPRGAGAVITFDLNGGRPAGRKFIEALKLISHAAAVGDAKSLAIHAASTTHRHMDVAELHAAGIGEGMVRLSVGIEAAEDIIADLAQALRASQRG